MSTLLFYNYYSQYSVLMFIFYALWNTYYRCDREKLENAMIKRKINTPEGVITTTVDPNSATVSRDGLAKQIYCRLFDW